MNNLSKKIGTAVALVGVMGLARADEGTDAIVALGTTAALYISAAFGVAILVSTGFWGIGMMKKAFRSSK